MNTTDYQFTGHYGRKDEMKLQMAKIRNAGFKCKLKSVRCPTYSRSYSASCIVGYQIVAEPAYFIQRQISELKQYLSSRPAGFAELIKRQSEELNRFNDETVKAEQKLKELQEG